MIILICLMKIWVNLVVFRFRKKVKNKCNYQSLYHKLKTTRMQSDKKKQFFWILRNVFIDHHPNGGTNDMKLLILSTKFKCRHPVQQKHNINFGKVINQPCKESVLK